MARTIAIGIQDFQTVIQNHYFYVDKTEFIKEWWENGDTVTLITRPRRFGKTLAMDMVYHFLSARQAEGSGGLFENLNIWKEEYYRKLQGTFPVIFLSFADVKGNHYTIVRKKLCQLIINLYMDHYFLLDSGFLSGEDAAFFKRITIDMDDADAALSLNQLSRYLYHYYGKKVVILLDEYDTPMQEAYVSGYWKEMTDFMKGLFNSAFKTNPYMERSVLTGTTRVSKESVFSDLNNLEVITTTSEKYEASFGFTEEEVFAALEEYGLQDKKDDVKRWYDGFRFGSCDNIYNPWSITQFLEKRKVADYWANTSSNKFVGDLIQKGSPDMKTAMEDLLHGKTLCTVIDEQIVFDQLDCEDEAVWSFLVAGGYLKIVGCVKRMEDSLESPQYELAVTNLEAMLVFKKIVHGWFSNKRYGYNKFLMALMDHDLDNMNTYMNEVALHTFSSFDSGRRTSEKTEPERFYHGFVLGLVIDIADRYQVHSNRESGLGRYDVLLEPRNCADDGIIFEFKVFDPKKEKDLKAAADHAIKQIIEKKYAAQLEKKGVSKDKIRIYGFAFEGKHVWIEGGFAENYDTCAE